MKEPQLAQTVSNYCAMHAAGPAHKARIELKHILTYHPHLPLTLPLKHTCVKAKEGWRNLEYCAVTKSSPHPPPARLCLDGLRLYYFSLRAQESICAPERKDGGQCFKGARTCAHPPARAVHTLLLPSLLPTVPSTAANSVALDLLREHPTDPEGQNGPHQH